MASESAGVGSALPDQTGYSGYILTTNGVTASWEVSSASLPSQTGNSGKYLTTDGSVASWATVSTGVTTMAAVGSSANANGASISSSTLTLQPASASFPGVVTTGAQTFAGDKNFGSGTTTFHHISADGNVICSAGVYGGDTNSSGVFRGQANATGSNTGVILNNAFHTLGAGDLVLSVQNNSAPVLEVSPTVLDLTGLGTGGSILIKDTAGGTVRTLVVTAGALVIT